MSPYDRERYDPRPRYNDDYGLISCSSRISARLMHYSDAHSRHNYSTSPRRHNQPFPPTRRAPPPDPHTFDYPATLKQYADWFRYFYPAQATEEDIAADYEPGLRVPTTVLDECHNLFLAAYSNRVKASTTFFADTGLMALLCRHDRVLWLVNMTSAGEKQHYALSLLDKLFQHIPKTMRIGVLYDIGCQLHRSCENGSYNIWYICFSCIWSSVALSAYLSSTQMSWVWFN